MNESQLELIRLNAEQAIQLLQQREVSPLELVDASIACIERTDSRLNAIPTRCFERARTHARQLMDRPASAPPLPLGGLPIAIKDLEDVAGVRTTYGSPIFADHVPARSDLLVERLEAAGGIVMGKSNTPEFGAGASTFNEVFGMTRNPWNPDCSVAGSSGGSAAALAAGQVWLATGSDMGGSLRVPASFNGIVGVRPSPGCVARTPGSDAFDTLSVAGPMARTAADTALMLDAMSGAHTHDPLASASPAIAFREAMRTLPQPLRLAFSEDLGITRVDAEVARLCRGASEALADHTGASLTDTAPDFSGAQSTFQTLRAAAFATGHAGDLERYRDQLKHEVIWNTEKGLALRVSDVAAAEQQRRDLITRVGDFFGEFDLLLAPTAIVPPFAVEVRYVEAANGLEFHNYIDWITLTYAVSLLGGASLSAPAAITAAGLPVGLQIIAPPRGEALALAAAERLDQVTGLSKRLPVDAGD